MNKKFVYQVGNNKKVTVFICPIQPLQDILSSAQTKLSKCL